jgi:hypothetical protein
LVLATESHFILANPPLKVGCADSAVRGVGGVTKDTAFAPPASLGRIGTSCKQTLQKPEIGALQYLPLAPPDFSSSPHLSVQYFLSSIGVHTLNFITQEGISLPSAGEG